MMFTHCIKGGHFIKVWKQAGQEMTFKILKKKNLRGKERLTKEVKKESRNTGKL